MNSVYKEILSLVLIYRYPALFVISFLSSLGIPLPAAATAVAAAAFAGQGYLNIILVVLFGAVGNIAGDLTMYWLVRLYGKKILLWLRLGKFLESPIVRNVEGTVQTYEAPIIVASRFQDQATVLVNIISGLAKMDVRKFTLFVSIGDLLQIIFYVTVGFLFANNWQAIYSAVGNFGLIIGLIVVIAITVLSARAINRHLKNKL